MMPVKTPLRPVQSTNGLFRALGVDARALPRTRPFYRRLVDVIEAGIGRGAVPAGYRLPPERDLARTLGVSRATVVSAYRELESRGLVRGYVGRGTFVSAAPEPDGAPFAWRGKVAASVLGTNETMIRDLMREASNPDMLSIAAGTPALDVFPAAAFTEAMERVLTRYGRAVWS